MVQSRCDAEVGSPLGGCISVPPDTTGECGVEDLAWKVFLAHEDLKAVSSQGLLLNLVVDALHAQSP